MTVFNKWDLNCKLAETLGYRFWLEKRGDYELAVTAKPGAREPWKRSRNGTDERYTPCSAVEAMQAGFYGVGVPDFFDSREAMDELLDHIDLKYKVEIVRHLDGWKATIAYRGIEEAYSTISRAVAMAAYRFFELDDKAFDND